MRLSTLRVQLELVKHRRKLAEAKLRKKKVRAVIFLVTCKTFLAIQEAEMRAEEARRKAAEGQISFNPSVENRTIFKRTLKKGNSKVNESARK